MRDRDRSAVDGDAALAPEDIITLAQRRLAFDAKVQRVLDRIVRGNVFCEVSTLREFRRGYSPLFQRSAVRPLTRLKGRACFF